MLKCHIEAPTQVALGEALELKFKLTNITTKALAVLKWNTPLEGAWFNSSFNVTRDGQWVAYTGAMVKRFRPSADDYVTIAPGASVEQTVNMAQAYEMKKAGVYKLVFNGFIQDVQPVNAEHPLGRQRQMNQVSCNALTVTIK